MVLTILGGVSDFVALSLAAQSLVATLGSLALVANAIWAPLILNEGLNLKHYMATVVIVVGVTLAIVYGPTDDKHYSMDVLLSIFSSTAFAVYASLVLLLAGGIYFSIQYVEWSFDLDRKPKQEQYIDSDGSHPILANYHKASYGLLSGIVGSQSVLLAKFIGELVSITISGKANAFLLPSTYMILAFLVGTVVLQIHWLNAGIARFQAVYVLPVFQATWTLASVIGGISVFSEWSSLQGSLTQQVMFPLGILIAMGGVAFLCSTPPVPDGGHDNERNALSDRMKDTVCCGAGTPRGCCGARKPKGVAAAGSVPEAEAVSLLHGATAGAGAGAARQELEQDNLVKQGLLMSEESLREAARLQGPAAPAPISVYGARNGDI